MREEEGLFTRLSFSIAAQIKTWLAEPALTCLFISPQRGSLSRGRGSTCWMKTRRTRRRIWLSRWHRWRLLAKCCWTEWSTRWSQYPPHPSTVPHHQAITSHHPVTVAARGKNLNYIYIILLLLNLFLFLVTNCVCFCVGRPLLMVKSTLRGTRWRTASGWSSGQTPWLGNYIFHIIFKRLFAVVIVAVVTAAAAACVSCQSDPGVPRRVCGSHPHSQSRAQTSRATPYAEPRAGCGPRQGSVPCWETSSGGWEESHVEGSTVNITHNKLWWNIFFTYFVLALWYKQGCVTN